MKTKNSIYTFIVLSATTIFSGCSPKEASLPQNESSSSEAEVKAETNLNECSVDVCGVPFDFVWVDAGSFLMGSPKDEIGRDNDDEEQHKVTITKGYWIGKYEVTQEQWEKVMGNNPSKHQGAKYPVEKVTWWDCQEFIQRINSAQDKISVKLPTEAEWEFAARGGVKSGGFIFSGSSTNLNAIAWNIGNSENSTHEVGLLAPNELGIYDMSGNVFEFCQNGYQEYSQDPLVDPEGPTGDEHPHKCIRGGSFEEEADMCRIAYRDYYFVCTNNAKNISERKSRQIGLRLIGTSR